MRQLNFFFFKKSDFSLPDGIYHHLVLIPDFLIYELSIVLF